MADYAKIRTNAVVLNPVTAASVPENSAIFADSVGGSISSRESGGGVDTVGGGSSTYKKLMQSTGAIAAGRPVSKLANGKIVEADSDAINGQEFIGITLEAFLGVDDIKQVLLLGSNAVGVLTGLGFTPGDDIFLGESGGYTDDTTGFTGSNDSIIKIGVADCAAGAASGTATDLVIFPEVLARP